MQGEQKSINLTPELAVTGDGILQNASKTASVQLSPQRHEILIYLFERRGQIVTYADLRRDVWRREAVEDAAIQKTLSRLRQTLLEVDGDAELIETIPRRGYRWAAPAAVVQPPAVTPQHRYVPMAAVATVLLALVAYAGLNGYKSKHERAVDLYQQGMQVWDERSMHSDGESLKLFRAALNEDPALVAAQTGIARSLVFQAYPAPGAKEAVDGALQMDATYGPAYSVRGFYRMAHEWNWEGAFQDLTRGVQLAPDDPTANHWLGLYEFIRKGCAVQQDYLERAHKLAPTSRAIGIALAKKEFLCGTRQHALSLVDSYARPDGPGFESLAMRWLMGDMDFVRKWSKKDTNPAPENLVKTLMSNTESSYAKAQEASLLGKADDAVAHLAKAIEHRDFQVFLMKIDPLLSAARKHPEFPELLGRIGLGGRI